MTKNKEADESANDDEEIGEEEKIDPKAVVAELAKMSPLEYDQIRLEQAARLGVRPQTLDREVKELRAHKASRENEEQEPVEFLIDPVPWDQPVEGAGLLDTISHVAASHLILPSGAADTIALWSLFAHAHDCFSISPILAAISPTPECGKTTLLTLLTGLVPKPLQASNVTPAVLFRSVEKWAPTLLIDEADTFLAGNDELRGILNAGHNRAYAYVLRAVGEDYEPKQFRVWAPKAIAKIGGLPPTLHSRAIQIRLQRKRSDEKIVALRADRLGHLDPLLRQAARWVIDNSALLKTSDPEVPENLDGRAADNWRPLFAIADQAGGKWPKKARALAEVAVSRASEETAGVMLLADIESIFEKFKLDKIHSDELVSHLGAMEERPWAEWSKGKPLTKNQLAALLKDFEVEPTQVWANSLNKRGYLLESFQKKGLFERYSPPKPPQGARALDALQDKELRGIRNARPKIGLALQTDRNPLCTKGSSGLAPQNPLDVENISDGDPYAGLKDEKWRAIK